MHSVEYAPPPLYNLPGITKRQERILLLKIANAR